MRLYNGDSHIDFKKVQKRKCWMVFLNDCLLGYIYHKSTFYEFVHIDEVDSGKSKPYKTPTFEVAKQWWIAKIIQSEQDLAVHEVEGKGEEKQEGKGKLSEIQIENIGLAQRVKTLDKGLAKIERRVKKLYEDIKLLRTSAKG